MHSLVFHGFVNYFFFKVIGYLVISVNEMTEMSAFSKFFNEFMQALGMRVNESMNIVVSLEFEYIYFILLCTHGLFSRYRLFGTILKTGSHHFLFSHIILSIIL